jgi:hypothetical protein
MLVARSVQTPLTFIFKVLKFFYLHILLYGQYHFLNSLHQDVIKSRKIRRKCIFIENSNKIKFQLKKGFEKPSF